MKKIQSILNNRNKLSSLIVGLFLINVIGILFWSEINKHNQQNKQYEFEKSLAILFFCKLFAEENTIGKTTL
jgi:peptidoglycan biosynthesis protein MviN/MurJ (putative lipid II flippase)